MASRSSGEHGEVKNEADLEATIVPQLRHGLQPREPLQDSPPYLWTSSLADHEKQELRFSGFEPCYIACIKDLEWQIKRKFEGLDVVGENVGLADDMSSLLLQYSQLIEALSKIESKDRVFEEDLLGSDNKLNQYSGMKRRISRQSQDSDKVHDRLRDNIVLVVLGYIYTWDVADSLKRRFGNLTATLDRFLTGLAGGVALLVPMIMMTFLTGRTARLVTVSVATMLFAAVMSLTTASKDSVIAATAAYAAIMVVYIGSSDTVA